MQKQQTHHFETLESGLRTVIVPMEGTQTVTVMVVAGTGSKYETKNISGISHFLEHMMFKGTSRRPGPLDISQELESIGAEYNAFTSKENTTYYARASANKFDLLLDVISDIYLNSKLDERDIATEKGVIIEEINMYRDNPARYVGDLTERLLYGDQPAGWDIAGEKETVSALKRDDFVNYFQTHYIAGNTVIAVAGQVDIDEVKEKINRIFNVIRKGPAVTKLAVKEEQTVPQTLIHWKETDQSHFELALRAFDMFDNRKYGLSMLGIILGGGMSSRLFQEVRVKRGLAYYVNADSSLYTDTGVFSVHAGVNKDRTLEAIQVVLEEIAKVRDGGIIEKELRQAKDHVRGSMALYLENSGNIAMEYGNSVLFENKVLTPEEKLAKIDSVTSREVHKIARDIFDNKKLNLALIGPFKEGQPFKEILKL